MKEIILNARDGYPLYIHIFEIAEPKAVVQIVHGMEEHQERYEDLALFLNEKGFTVVSSDMRGHGKHAENLGYFKDRKGYIELIEDQKVITRYIQDKYKNIQIYVFAHSMGTIITRVLLQENSKNYQKIILSGYPNYHAGAYLGIIIANVLQLFRGAKYKSNFIQNLSVGAFNKKIKNPKTEFDWICNNEKNVQAYINDLHCGIGFTCSAFNDLFHLVILMHKPSRYININKNMDMLLLRGKDDPCVGGDNGATDSYNVLVKAGFNNIKKIDYSNMRHEIIAELDNEKVYNDIADFFIN